MHLPRRGAAALVAVLIACGPVVAGAQAVRMKLVPMGAMQKIGGYMPQRLALSTTKPAELKVPPPGLQAPLYGTLKVGPRESPKTHVVILDEPEGKPSRLFVDANGNGNLTDDPAAEWQGRAYAGQGGTQYRQYMGGASVRLGGAQGTPVHLGIYRFDKRDPQRAQFKDALFFYPDYAYEGQVTLGGKPYRVMLVDDRASGDFRPVAGDGGSGIRLLIDVNGNGQFDRRGEMYDASQPFNIGGTTYEIQGLTQAGDRLTMARSSKTVAEILPPPDLGAGKPAIPFQAKTTDGKEVRFPQSYKGKVVLLDFWATWCGPCIAELPHLTAAYQKYHPQGFEILGISLDRPEWAEKLAAFTKEKNMPWAQVYDGKYWQAEIGQLYGVDSIPRAILVDGDTGRILADGVALRGDNLGVTIEKALASKK